MHHLSDATRFKVLKVLGGISPEQASTWIDDVRQDPAYRYLAPCHYANIEPDSAYTPAVARGIITDLKKAYGARYQPAAVSHIIASLKMAYGVRYQPTPGGDIITALNRAYGELQRMDTLSPERLRFDVLVLFHLCGDLTQPLHVGYGSDKGGNDYQVQYNGKGTDLHHIWDSEIIASQGITMSSLAADNEFSKPADKEFMLKRPVSFMDQLEQSLSILPLVYRIGNRNLSQVYMTRGAENVRYQLILGGNLLASCLDHIFSQVKSIPVVIESAGTKGR